MCFCYAPFGLAPLDPGRPSGSHALCPQSCTGRARGSEARRSGGRGPRRGRPAGAWGPGAMSGRCQQALEALPRPVLRPVGTGTPTPAVPQAPRRLDARAAAAATRRPARAWASTRRLASTVPGRRTPEPPARRPRAPFGSRLTRRTVSEAEAGRLGSATYVLAPQASTRHLADTRVRPIGAASVRASRADLPAPAAREVSTEGRSEAVAPGPSSGRPSPPRRPAPCWSLGDCFVETLPASGDGGSRYPGASTDSRAYPPPPVTARVCLEINRARAPSRSHPNQPPFPKRTVDSASPSP